MSPLRILLADDHGLVRAGLRALLEQIAGLVVVAEAGNGREALRLAQEHRPDVVLMDIGMKELNGLEATARLVKKNPAVKVVILSMHADQAYVRQTLHAGAAGYLLKGAGVEELALALKAVASGGTYLTPAVSKGLIDGLRSRAVPPDNPLAALTSRQREILQLVAEGHSTKAIAQRLTLSVKTVETHRADIMDRLDIHDVPGLVKFAIRTGLVWPDQ
jgi:DNA-binding NarL/FixJ family response regulator